MTVLCLLLTAALAPRPCQDARNLYVDPVEGRADASGEREDPLPSISHAIARLPEWIEHDVTIHLAAGHYDSTGGQGMPERSLQLGARMAPEVSVRFVGSEANGGDVPVLAWMGERRMVDVHEGTWRFENLQIGTFSKRQRRGVMVTGPAVAVLKNVTSRLRSDSDAGIFVRRGGRAHLRGAIRLNEHLHERAEDETFCGIYATDHGVVEFDEKRGSSLDMGNGNLSVSYYGSIRLGCDSARVTSWTKSNTLTVNNGGRVDLRNTPTTLRAARENNVAIGLEHDGHVLAEDAHITIVGPGEAAIALQKASTLTCNDIELRGEFRRAIWAKSGSMFVGRFLTDIHGVDAATGAGIHIEKTKGEIHGPLEVASGGVISLPDRTLRSE